jgi:hypothetical protein
MDRKKVMGEDWKKEWFIHSWFYSYFAGITE